MNRTESVKNKALLEKYVNIPNYFKKYNDYQI